jgi:hypothetical protein
MRDPNLTADIERANAAKARQFRAAAQRLYPGRADGLNEYEAAGLKLQAERREREQREREREAYFAAAASGERSLSGRPCSRVEAGWALAILEAVPSAVLSANAKRLWRRYVELDRPRSGKPGGCWAKRATLAGRLGMNAGSVKRLQRDLRALNYWYLRPWATAPARFPCCPSPVLGPKASRPGERHTNGSPGRPQSSRHYFASGNGNGRPHEIPGRIRGCPLQNVPPERYDLYPMGAQIVPPRWVQIVPTI